MQFQVKSWADLPRAIAIMQQVAPHRVPLLRALHEGRIAYYEANPEWSCQQFKRWCAMSVLPRVALVGDDHEQPTGPDGWRVARRMIQWARFVVLHGTGGQAWDYSGAIPIAQTIGAVLIIECGSANLPAWQAAIQRWAPEVRGMILAPPDDGVHPIPPDRRRAH